MEITIREIESNGWVYSHVPTVFPSDRTESIERRKLHKIEPDDRHWDNIGQALLRISRKEWIEATRFGKPYQYGRRKQ